MGRCHEGFEVCMQNREEWRRILEKVKLSKNEVVVQ
jgi:hypothetical protein